MKPRLLIVLISLFALVAFTQAQTQPQTETQAQTQTQTQDATRNQPTAKSQDRIIKEVRHKLLMLPYFGVFDNIAFKVEGSTVTLLGEVVRPISKSDAADAVKHVEGVDKVDDQIEVLPPAPMDQRLRRQLYRAIYRYPALERYAMGVQKPIRIIVKNGHVTLEGVVDSDGDKNIAGIQANGVSGAFSVTNNLRVEKP